MNYKYINYFLFGILLFLIVLLSLYSIAVSDDFWHAYFITKQQSLINSPFVWTYGQYMNWTGRILVSFFQGLLIFKPINSNISSSINITFFCFAILYEIKQQIQNELSINKIIIYFIFVFVVCFRVIGEAVYWMSAIYTIPFMFFIFAKAHLYNFKNTTHKKNQYLWGTILFCLLGNSIELLFFPTLYILLNNFKKFNENKNDKSYFNFMVAAFLIGALLNVISPGNIKHIQYAPTNLGFNLFSHLEHLWGIFKRFGELIPLHFILLVPLFLFSKQSKTYRPLNRTFENFLISILSIVVLAPIYGFASDRTYLYSLIFMAFVLIDITLFIKFKLTFLMEKDYEKYLLTPYLILFIFVILQNILDAEEVRKSFLLEQEKLSIKAHMSDSITIDNHRSPMSNHILYYTFLGENPKMWPNISQAKYYNLKNISGK